MWGGAWPGRLLPPQGKPKKGKQYLGKPSPPCNFHSDKHIWESTKSSNFHWVEGGGESLKKLTCPLGIIGWESYLLILWHQKPKTGERKLMKRLWNRRDIWGRVKCTGLEIAPQCMGGPKRCMYTLPHSYIFRNSFNFYHSTTLTHRKRAPKVTGKVTSNSGFVRSAISSHM